MKNIAIIPSGGIGTRLNSPIPKQYIEVLGKELIYYTLNTFQNCNLIDQIIIPAHESYFDLLHQIKEKYGFTKIKKIVAGGKERQDSVYQGFLNSDSEKEDLIIVHDAARPLLSPELLEKAILLANEKSAAIVALKARDTLLNIESNKSEYLDRNNIYYIQTPQICKNYLMEKAYKIAIENNFLGTDESMLLKNANIDFEIVEGESINFKITTNDDLEIFKKLLVS